MDWSPLWISIATSVTATVITLFLGLAAAAWREGRKGPAMALVDGVFLLPLVLPPTVVGFLLLLLFGRNGPLGKLFLKFGATIVFSWPATVIAATVVAFPLMYLTARAALEQVEPSLLQAARTLGASEWRVFREVALPLAWPGVLAGTILSFARALGEFGATLMLAGNIPGRTETIPIAIYFAVEANDMPVAATWCLIDIGISLTLLAGLYYWTHLQAPDARAVGSPLMALEVQIEKKLLDFTLDVSFRAEAEPLSILGASGAGKTMLLRCIAGLERPDRGRIKLNDRVFFDSESRVNISARQRRVGMLFQNYAIFPHRTVAENIGFGLEALPRDERSKRVAELIGRTHLFGLEDRYSRTLSGGEQQRVALARALAIEPEALLLDEPLSALDTHLRSQMEVQLQETFAAYRRPTLLVTHNMEEAYRLGARLLVLSRGRVVASGAKERIFQRPPSVEVARLTGCKNISRARTISDHSVEALDWGCTLRVAQPVAQANGFVGIRAHHIEFVEANGASSEENIFPCGLVRSSETPFRITLFLSLQQDPSTQPESAHLQAEVYKEKWQRFRDKPFPWHVRVPSDSLFWMKE